MIDRRAFIASSGALMAMPAIAQTAIGHGDLSSQVTALDPLKTAMRLRGSADGALTMSYLEAVREVVIDGEITPFCDLKAFIVARYVPVGDIFEAQVLEVAYYIDPETGQPLEEFRFPGQKTAVTVPKYRTGPITVRFASELDEWEEVNPGKPGEASADFAPPSRVRLQRNIQTPWRDRDKILVRTNEYGRAYVGTDLPPAVFYREWIIYEASLAEVLNSRAPSIPAEYSYAAMSSARPWMKLGDTQAYTVSNGRGRKIAGIEALPDDLYKLVEQHDPDMLADPALALSRPLER